MDDAILKSQMGTAKEFKPRASKSKQFSGLFPHYWQLLQIWQLLTLLLLGHVNCKPSISFGDTTSPKTYGWIIVIGRWILLFHVLALSKHPNLKLLCLEHLELLWSGSRPAAVRQRKRPQSYELWPATATWQVVLYRRTKRGTQSFQNAPMFVSVVVERHTFVCYFTVCWSCWSHSIVSDMILVLSFEWSRLNIMQRRPRDLQSQTVVSTTGPSRAVEPTDCRWGPQEMQSALKTKEDLAGQNGEIGTL